MNKKRLAAGAAALGLSILLAGCGASPEEATASGSAEPSSSASATVSATATATATATASVDQEAQPTETAESAFVGEQSISITGDIESLDTDGEVVVVTEEYGPVACKTSDKTIFVNAVTGRKTALADLDIGARIRAAVSPQMTRSIPAQTRCFAVIVDVPENGIGNASYVQVQTVTKEDDGTLEILDQNGSTIVRIPKDIPVELYGSDATVPKDEIVSGSDLIVWYDQVTFSIPAQTTALRVVYCPADR